MMRDVDSVPTATVRLQIHAGFDLDAAADVVPYYAALGISHYYVSPLQQSRAGSTHGYDGTDPTCVDPLRGGRAGLRRLVARLREHGMGLILDIAPNHLSSSLENAWWYDVLERGRASRYAGFFAIDWGASDPASRIRILLPVLTEMLDELIRKRKIALVWDAPSSRICAAVDGQAYPLHARTHAELLRGLLPRVAEAFVHADEDRSLHQARLMLWSALQAREVRESMDAHLRAMADDGERIGAILGDQCYELAHWQDASTRINWRRFFDINELVALRSEDAQVFEAFHALVFELYAAGEIDGVRIDHVDGLADPAGYLTRLRARFAALEAQRPLGAGQRRAWIVVEKILAPDELLQSAWPIDGSTGYDFMDQVSALLHDDSAGPALDAAWALHGGDAWPDIVTRARDEILANAFGAEFDRLCRRVAELAPAIARADLRAALQSLLVHYARYRGYALAGKPDHEDRVTLEKAARAARSSGLADDAALDVAMGIVSGSAATGADAHADAAVAAFQQLSAPLAARAIEDTAFYRYARLLSRNEVGANPGQLSVPARVFHQRCSDRATRWPRSLLCTASHDHKRGEDARMRIASLADEPSTWLRWLERRACSADGQAPDLVDRIQLFQTMAGMGDALMRDDACERLQEWQKKVIRERKVHGSWAEPDAAYEDAATRYVRDVLGDPEVRHSLRPILDALDVPAAVRGLAQTVLRCTTPGIPDLYQGTEFWDLSLVDPDNRSEVDYSSRRAGLASTCDDAVLLERWRDGRVKQRLLQGLLKARAAMPEVFAGSCSPVRIDGPLANRFIAFERRCAQTCLLVVVPIRPHGLFDDSLQLIAPTARETFVEVQAIEHAWDVVRRARATPLPNRCSLADLFATWPVAVLASGLKPGSTQSETSAASQRRTAAGLSRA